MDLRPEIDAGTRRADHEIASGGADNRLGRSPPARGRRVEVSQPAGASRPNLCREPRQGLIGAERMKLCDGRAAAQPRNRRGSQAQRRPDSDELVDVRPNDLIEIVRAGDPYRGRAVELDGDWP